MTTSGALTRKCAAEEAYVADAASRFVCPYQSVLLGAPQGVVLLPITGHEVILANAKARAYLDDLRVPETAEAIRARFFQLPRPGVPLAEHGDVDSETRTYRYANYFFDGTHLLFIEDVTDQRRYESIAANVDHENSMALLLASIRHELASPLAGLKASLASLAEDADDPRNGRAGHLEDAVAHVAAVERLVDMLCLFNSAETSASEPLRLDLFMIEFCELLAGIAEARGTCFSYVPFPPGITVSANRGSLQQVLTNVAANAFDAVEGVPGAALEVKVIVGPRYATVVVEDTGLGIAPGAVRHVFTPLFTTKKGGSGLGLAVARNLVSGMRGDIELRSELGVGTTVSVALQRLATPESAGRSRQKALSVGH